MGAVASENSALVAAALRWIQRGAAPIPVKFRSKQPVGREWEKQRHTAETITEVFNGTPLNLGILWGAPSKDLIDVDLDGPEAADAAASLLPRTATYGRAGSPGSHYVYRVASAATRQWVAPAELVPAGHKDVIVELRAEGTQSVVPPSTHPSGEPYCWERESRPTVIAHDALVRRLSMLAAAALLVPLWREGKRHPLALALSGAMLSAAYTADEARDFIGAVACAAGDEEIADRRLAVKSSQEAISEGKPATGIPKIAELIGEAAVGVLKRWLGLGNALPAAWLPAEGAAAPLLSFQ